MKVLLINPIYPDRPRAMYFPLGLAYISAALKRAGHSVEVIDTDAGIGLTDTKLRTLLANSEFDLVGIGGLITAFGHMRWLAALVKEVKANVPVVLGGGFASSLPEFSLTSTVADIACVGEGERTIVELAAVLEKSEPLASVNGIYFRENGKIRKNSAQELIAEIDDIAFPDWDAFPIEAYLKNMYRRKQTGSLETTMVLITSRACPFKCSFCYNPLGRKLRVRTTRNVMQELKLLKEKYDIKAVFFLDELFTINKNRVLDFCRQLERENLDLEWQCTSRTNLAELAMYKQMKKHACRTVQFGIESGSDEILKTMNKNATATINKRAIRIARKAGIEPTTSWMVGTFGETPDTIKSSLDFIREMNLYVPRIFFTTPYPDSEFFRRSINEHLIKDLEEFVVSLGNASEFCINLTKMPARKLKALKTRFEKEATRFYYRNNLAQIERVATKENGAIEIKFRCLLRQCQKEFVRDYRKTNIEEVVACPYCSKKQHLPLRRWSKFFGWQAVFRYLLREKSVVLRNRFVNYIPYYKKLRRDRYWLNKKQFFAFALKRIFKIKS